MQGMQDMIGMECLWVLLWFACIAVFLLSYAWNLTGLEEISENIHLSSPTDQAADLQHTLMSTNEWTYVLGYIM